METRKTQQTWDIAMLLKSFAAAIVTLAIGVGPLSAQECRGTNLLETLTTSQRNVIRSEGETIPNGSGTLFRVTGEGVAPSYIYAMVHSTDPRVKQLPYFVLEAIAETDVLAIETAEMPGELDVPVTESRPELFYLEDGTVLSDLLDQDILSTLETHLENIGMTLEDVSTMQPWLVLQTISRAECESARREQGEEILDARIIELGEKSGSEIVSLETQEEQFEAFSYQSIDQQVEMISAGGLTSEIGGQDMLETLIEFHAEGMPGSVKPLIDILADAGGKKNDGGYAEWWDRVITTRNGIMADRLEPLLKEGGVFVSIGIIHVSGENGVVELVQKQGWDIEVVR